jgi:hypothetical protein
MKKLLAGLLVLTSCFAHGTIKIKCEEYAPHSDLDPEGVLFEKWQGTRQLDYGNHQWSDGKTIVGWSLAEDGAIVSSEACL